MSNRPQRWSMRRGWDPADAQERAHSLVGNFFKKLKLQRIPCECGSTEVPHTHHIDYERPWLVAFLCPKCHSHEHRGLLKRAYRLHDLRKPIVP